MLSVNILQQIQLIHDVRQKALAGKQLLENHQWRYAVSVGWRILSEDFLAKAIEAVSNRKPSKMTGKNYSR
ncbi:MAG: hypothetical protein AAGB19_01355 [Cyanobacteria bacterium P01_F01_bin.3]